MSCFKFKLATSYNGNSPRTWLSPGYCPIFVCTFSRLFCMRNLCMQESLMSVLCIQTVVNSLTKPSWLAMLSVCFMTRRLLSWRDWRQRINMLWYTKQRCDFLYILYHAYFYDRPTNTHTVYNYVFVSVSPLHVSVVKLPSSGSQALFYV
jgi:hypothetical protein